MITKDFNELKKRLSELSSVINSFKSEAVQLKIVETVLQGLTISDEEEKGDEDGGKERRAKKRLRKKPIDVQDRRKPKKGRQTARVGAATVLNDLITDGYFKSKHTLSDIMSYASLHKARKLKATELSGPLARFVRSQRLKREKNKDGQFAYFQG